MTEPRRRDAGFGSHDLMAWVSTNRGATILAKEEGAGPQALSNLADASGLSSRNQHVLVTTRPEFQSGQ